MTVNEHERARRLIALSGADAGDDGRAAGQARLGGGRAEERRAEGERAWLRVHLQECEACRDYTEAVGGAIRALRSHPMAAGSGLVRATQMRVRARALELRRQRERMWLVGLSCVFVGMSAAITTPLLWRGFAWVGEWVGVSSWVWQAGFTFVWIVPALVASVLLLDRGTHLNGANGSSSLSGAGLGSSVGSNLGGGA
jgi:predicted anti-sigma-YlaC factor YlaD